MNKSLFNPVTAALGILAVVLALLVSSARADQPKSPTGAKAPKTRPAAVRVAGANTMPYEVTGSLIRQRVERRGVIATTTSSPVTVIDAEAIRRCGASTVVDVLRKHGNR